MSRVDHEADRAQQITSKPDDLVGIVETHDRGAGFSAVDRGRLGWSPFADERSYQDRRRQQAYANQLTSHCVVLEGE